VLRGYDQQTNLVLEDASERVYSTKAGVEVIALGLYVVRGDNMCARGRVCLRMMGRWAFLCLVCAASCKINKLQNHSKPINQNLVLPQNRRRPPLTQTAPSWARSTRTPTRRSI
jgi:hypothetical protein